MSEQLVDSAIVFFVGALVGLGELVARYRDNPWRAIRTLPALTYIGINGLASLFALMTLLTFGWTPDQTATPEAIRLLRVLAAGFGAMALFRTSLFVVRVGTTDVGVGPVAFLQILLAATDRGVDRKRASDRAEKVVRIMGDLDFSTAFNALPPFAIMLMQNLTLEDKNAIGDQVKALAAPASAVPNQTRVLNLGLMLMNYVGEEVLEDAVRGVQGQPKPKSVLERLNPRSRDAASHRDLESAGSDAAGAGSAAGSDAAGAGSDAAVAGGDGAAADPATTPDLPTPADLAAATPEPPKSDGSEPPPGTSAPGTPIPRKKGVKTPAG